MAGGAAKAEPEPEPEPELSSRSSSGWDSDKWETSEKGRTKSKNKFLPDGFLDPLPPQKPSKLPRFSGYMVEEATRRDSRGCRQHAGQEVVDCGPAPPEVHPSIAALRGKHRAAHPDKKRAAKNA